MDACEDAEPKRPRRESFIQPLTRVIRNRGQLTPAELAVYLDLQSYDWSGEGTWVGQKTIASELGISERTVRDAIKVLARVGAIECQPRPGRSHLYKVKSGWLPGDNGTPHRRKKPTTAVTTPAKPAAHPGKIRRTPRRNLPHSPAESAAETDVENYIQKAKVRTDLVPPPAASRKVLSGATSESSQEKIQEQRLKNTVPTPARSSNNSSTYQQGKNALAQSLSNADYSTTRLDPNEEAMVVELAHRFNQIQTIMGAEKATGVRWQKTLTGFRMMLFSPRHKRSYRDACLVLDYLKNNPVRAKEIVNMDKKRGVTNTYHLMFLFERLHNEAIGHNTEVENMFSKRQVHVDDRA
jgi:Helix-turn-helix domain